MQNSCEGFTSETAKWDVSKRLAQSCIHTGATSSKRNCHCVAACVRLHVVIIQLQGMACLHAWPKPLQLEADHSPLHNMHRLMLFESLLLGSSLSVGLPTTQQHLPNDRQG